jgi:hypothetical protein
MILVDCFRSTRGKGCFGSESTWLGDVVRLLEASFPEDGRGNPRKMVGQFDKRIASLYEYEVPSDPRFDRGDDITITLD